MTFNGTHFMTDPLSEVFEPFTDFFESAFGVGGLFFVTIIMILSVGIYMKTQDITYTSIFLACSSGFLSAGSYMGGLPELSMLFAVFMAIGISSLAINLILQTRR